MLGASYVCYLSDLTQVNFPQQSSFRPHLELKHQCWKTTGNWCMLEVYFLFPLHDISTVWFAGSALFRSGPTPRTYGSLMLPCCQNASRPMKKDIWKFLAQYLIRSWVTLAVWLGERILPPRVFDCFENIWPKINTPLWTVCSLHLYPSTSNSSKSPYYICIQL